MPFLYNALRESEEQPQLSRASAERACMSFNPAMVLCGLAMMVTTNAALAAAALAPNDAGAAHGRTEARLTAHGNGTHSPDLLSGLAFVDAPPPAPRPAGPSPLREPDEYARRSWEVFPALAVGAPFCRGQALGSGRCGESSAGASIGGGALYRLTPYVAVGGEVHFTSFAASPSADAFSRTRWFGLTVRGYFLDRGVLDPYLEAGLGVGSVDAGYAADGHAVQLHGTGPSSSAAAGLDFWVLPYLRLGPALSYRFTWLTQVEQCQDGACAMQSVSDSGAVGSQLSVSLLATFSLGREM
jgi:hypothetical protein